MVSTGHMSHMVTLNWKISADFRVDTILPYYVILDPEEIDLLVKKSKLKVIKGIRS